MKNFYKSIILGTLFSTITIHASGAYVSRMICRVSDQYAYIEFSNVTSYIDNIMYGIYDGKRGKYISKHTHTINKGWVNYLNTWNKNQIPKYKIGKNRWLVVKINGKTTTKRCK